LEPVPASVPLATFSQALLEDLTEASVNDSQPLRLLAEYHFGGADKLLTSKRMVAYKISYADKQSLPHLVYVVHLLANGMGVQFIADTTENIAAQMTPEFVKTIRSIRLPK
jgi:hypothetical protein